MDNFMIRVMHGKFRVPFGLLRFVLVAVSCPLHTPNNSHNVGDSPYSMSPASRCNQRTNRTMDSACSLLKCDCAGMLPNDQWCA